MKQRLRRALKPFGPARQALRALVQTKSLSYARLVWIARRQPRYTPGTLRFPFGPLRYVDAASLRSQYLEIFLQREYDFATSEAMPLIFDCGGNVGLSALRFKQCYPHSRVIVFEADPAIAAVLQANITMLGLQQVTVVCAAVWDKIGSVLFAADQADGGHITQQSAGQQVPSIRLADYINQPVHLLKLDIEGAEYDVLHDLCHSGQISLVQKLICEFHGSAENRHRLGAVLASLQQQGFRTTFTYARSAPDMPGLPEPTPFVALRDGKYLLRMYAWQSDPEERQ